MIFVYLCHMKWIEMLKVLALIGFGSAIGGVARYALSRLMVSVAGVPSFWGTLAANVLGCFLIGLLYGLFERHNIFTEHWRLFLTVGFCGGFTTFSTFVHENYSAITEGHFLLVALYASLSFLIGLLMVHAGHKLVM